MKAALKPYSGVLECLQTEDGRDYKAPMCEMPNALFEYDGEKNTTSDGTPCVHWQDPDTNHTVASYRKEDFPATALLHFHESDEAIPNLEYCFNPVTQASSTFHNIREALQKFCNDTVQALCYTGSYMVAISISCDVCGPPPKVARMKSPDGVYRANDSATYTCDDDFYPISDGPTTITCRSDLTWTDFPEQSLRCEKWTNYASQGGARAEDASLSTLSELTDDDVTSCVSLDSRTYTLHLVSEVEVGVVTFHFVIALLTSTACSTDVSTSGTYVYQPVWQNNSKLPSDIHTSITFEVKTCTDAHVLLTTHAQGHPDLESNLYEIVIGGWRNGKSVIRTSKQQFPSRAEVRHIPLHCDEYRKFYVSWADGIVKVGAVLSRGSRQDPFMVYEDPDPILVKYAYVSGFGKPAEWRFGKLH
nr:hypothetical protein BaRGS_032149 [Batillaria attramentaria]